MIEASEVIPVEHLQYFIQHFVTNSITASIKILSKRFYFVPDQIYIIKADRVKSFFDQFIFKKVCIILRR